MTRTAMRSRWTPWSVLVLAALLPLLTQDRYFQTILNMVLINAVLTLGFYVIFGMTGIFSIAQAAFWGVGAYTSAILTVDLGLPVWAGFFFAPLIAVAAGVLLGAPTLRLKTHYLTMATIGFAEVARQLMVNWDSLTHGPTGISGIPAPHIGPLALDTPRSYYYLSLPLHLGAGHAPEG